ncbi:hypothetical protein QOZ80_3BG0286480 [Eleusine coracana subsp. coracana]|nr:hypothetical protein QOZ80_3BG0286480 [Eleusine coracana subsp. coracana]
MGRTADRGQHGTAEEAAAEVSPMVEVKQERCSAPPVGLLEVLISSPEMSRRKVWPSFCFFEVYVGGERVEVQMLPGERKNRKLEKKDIENWTMHLKIPVGLDWPSLSLELFVKRTDYVPRKRGLRLIRGGPHTSRFDAVIGGAQLKLLDALIFGDDDEEEREGEDKSKKRRKEADDGSLPRMEGTLLFNKTVELIDWVVPAPDRSPHLVTRGTVHVLMAMFVPQG